MPKWTFFTSVKYVQNIRILCLITVSNGLCPKLQVLMQVYILCWYSNENTGVEVLKSGHVVNVLCLWKFCSETQLSEISFRVVTAKRESAGWLVLHCFVLPCLINVACSCSWCHNAYMSYMFLNFISFWGVTICCLHNLLNYFIPARDAA